MNTRTRWFAIVAAMLFASFAFAQETPAAPQARQPQEVVVRIQQDAPAAPKAGPTVVQKANEWAELGTNMGSALGGAAKAILNETKDATFGKDVSLVQGIDNFSKTDAGRFTMLVVAWKVMGQDAVNLLHQFLGVVIGVPLVTVVTLLYIWVIRRFFMPRTVVLSKSGGLFAKDAKVEYGIMNATNGYSAPDGVRIVSWINSDDRHGGLFLSSAIYLVVSAIIVATVIF